MSSRRSRKTSQLNYNHLHYFHVAAVEGSVGAAAQVLGVTQPTISEQLRTLERSLGVVLFERQSSGLKLTEAGRVAFQHTSVMFGAGDRLAEALDQGWQKTPARLRVGVCSSTAQISTPTLLTPLLGIDTCVPSIRVGDYVELVRDIRGGALDLVLCATEPPRSERRGLEVTVIERIMLAVVAPKSLVVTKDWCELSLLHYRVGSQLRWDVDAFLQDRALKPQVAAEADDAMFLVDAVERGHHVAIVPHGLVRDAIASGRLQLIDQFQSQHAGVYALYQPNNDTVRRAVERLVADHTTSE